MKVIKNNAIKSITASSENTAYPVANLLNSHPKKKWKVADSSISSVILNLTVSGTTGGLGMVGIVADAAAIHIEDPSGIVWDTSVTWGNTVWHKGAGVVEDFVEFSQGDDYATLWAEFEELKNSASITITLYKNSQNLDTIAAGVLVCGELTEFPNVLRPLNEGLKDHSVVRELANGSEYYRRRDIVRTFSGSLRVMTADFWNMLRGVARAYGRVPLMYRVVASTGEWVLYAKLSSMPAGVHDLYDSSLINFQLEEVL